MPHTRDDWIIVGGIAAGVCSFLLLTAVIFTI